MAIRNIITKEEPLLRKISRPVVKFDEKLAQLIDDMTDTMRQADGAGIAAVQVGVLRRVVVVEIEDGKGLVELVNPEIIYSSDETEEAEEACLSVPNECGVVRRPKLVKVKAQDRHGVWHEHTGEDLRARCYCHEIDHLNGHLYTDFVSRMLSEDEIRQMRKSSEGME